MSVLSRLFRIQPGEGRTVALVVAFTFLSVAGLTIGESGIDALFFDRIGPESLPVMYLAGGRRRDRGDARAVGGPGPV